MILSNIANKLVRWPVLILTSVIITLATVTVGNWIGGFGFPLAWKTGGCPPPGITISAPCFLAIGYDWLRFGLDVLFYTSICYVVLLALLRYRSRRVSRSHANKL